MDNNITVTNIKKTRNVLIQISVVCVIGVSCNTSIQVCRVVFESNLKRARHSCPGRYQRGRFVGSCRRTNRHRTFPARRSCRLLAAQARRHSAVRTCKVLGTQKNEPGNQMSQFLPIAKIKNGSLQDGFGACVNHQTAGFVLWSRSVLMLRSCIRRAHFRLFKSKFKISFQKHNQKARLRIIPWKSIATVGCGNYWMRGVIRW